MAMELAENAAIADDSSYPQAVCLTIGVYVVTDASMYRVRVRAAVRRPPDEVLVVLESRRGEPVVSLPGGAPKFGETLESALIREVREETGYETIPTDIAFITERRDARWEEPLIDIVFYTEIVAGSASQPLREPAADRKVAWLGYNDPRLTRFVPEARDFTASRKGRYNRSPRAG
jgi:ADP-ribose pyrophosphatase YjhB (NUDIX family)